MLNCVYATKPCDILMHVHLLKNISLVNEDCWLHLLLWVPMGFNQQITRFISSESRVMNPAYPGSDTQRKTE